MKKIFDFLKNQDWLLIMPPVFGLIIGCWPIGHHQWSYFWMTITVCVLIWEGASVWWFPEHKTISNVMRKFRQEHPVHFWVVQTCWLLFAWLLIVHLAT